MRGAKSAKWVAAAAIVALAATACGSGDDSNDAKPNGTKGADSGPKKAGGTFRLGSTEPSNIDPGRASDSTASIVANALYTGLYANTPDGSVEPALATSAESNADCTSWTFTIKGGTSFTNGEAVDAEAFARGWARAATKSLASDVAYHLAGIKGYDELQSGKAQAFSGLKAVDATTLKVDLTSGDCEFDKKTGHSVFSPMPKVAKPTEDSAWDLAPIGNGPFKVEGKWEHNKKITLVRNDAYGLTKAYLDRIEISLLNDKNAQDLEYQGFQSGQFDYAHIPTPQLKVAEAKYKPQGKWLTKDTNGMNYLLPITSDGPLKSKDARIAVSYAIDRAAIAKGIFQGFQTPSTTIVPPAFPKSYQKDLCESCKASDPAKAKEYAAKGGLKPGTALTLAYNTGAGHEEWVQAVAQQLKEVLGLDVKLDGKPFPQLLEEQQKPGATGLYRFAWGADYPTPDNYLYPLLHTDSMAKDENGTILGDNRGRYSNPEFDSLIKQARSSKDEAARIELYKKAEKIAMDDMALIPTWNRTQFRLVATDKFSGLDDISFSEDPIFEQIALK